jgi:DNA-binding TFAR19-related protein (PDSD5 family)
MDGLDELQERRAQQLAEEQQLAKEIAQLEAMVTPAMDAAALARFGAVKAAHPEKAIRCLVACAQLVKQGRRIDDAGLKELLVRLEPAQRKTMIRRV